MARTGRVAINLIKNMMCRKKGLTLVEILIAITLTGLIILAVTSVDITSRRFLGTASKESWIQDEAKIAMEHIVKNIQLGVGDMSNASTAVGSSPEADDTRGVLILDETGKLVASGSGGSQIQIKKDEDGNGRFDAGSDPIITYSYDSGNQRIVYTHPVTGSENLADGIVYSAIFEYDENIPNQVIVTITVRKDPTRDPSLENPETTLTSSIVLRAMSN